MYVGYICLYVLLVLGDVLLRKFGVVDFECWYAVLRDKGFGLVLICKVYIIVRVVLV